MCICCVYFLFETFGIAKISSRADLFFMTVYESYFYFDRRARKAISNSFLLKM